MTYTLSERRVFLIALLGILLIAPGLSLHLLAIEAENSEKSQQLDREMRLQLRRRHLTRLGIDGWHQQGNYGAGIKIAILDTGFHDYRQQLGKNLPAQVQVRSFRKDRSIEATSQHGVLCAEVVHMLAPQAELYLANWDDDYPQSFLEAVRWARQQGVHILTCSVIMPSWSDGEGGGSTHRDLQALLGSGQTPHDLLFFACAGNTALRHWSGPYDPDVNELHQWTSDETTNPLIPWGKERIAVELYGDTAFPFDVEVIQHANKKLVVSARLQTDSTQHCGRAVARFIPEPGVAYDVRVRGQRRAALRDGADRFHLVALGANLKHSMIQGSIPFPGDGRSVYAVGAVDDTLHRLNYSSCGSSRRNPKPDFVAPVPIPSLCRSQPFGGTSAATPQAAALAALLWSKHPRWLANEVRDAMRVSAFDLGPPGHDIETGYGMIHLPSQP